MLINKELKKNGKHHLAVDGLTVLKSVFASRDGVELLPGIIASTEHPDRVLATWYYWHTWVDR